MAAPTGKSRTPDKESLAAATLLRRQNADTFSWLYGQTGLIKRALRSYRWHNTTDIPRRRVVAQDDEEADEEPPGRLQMISDDEVDDLAGETILRLYEMGPKYDPKQSKVTTWIWREATYVARQYVRKELRSRLVDVGEELGEISEEAPEPPRPDNSEQLRRDLEEFISRLPKKFADVIRMRSFDMMPNQQIGERLNIKSNLVRTWFLRGKRMMGRAIRDSGRQQEMRAYLSRERPPETDSTA